MFLRALTPLSIWILKVMQQCVCVSCICGVSCCWLIDWAQSRKNRKKFCRSRPSTRHFIVCSHWLNWFWFVSIKTSIHKLWDFRLFIVVVQGKTLSLTKSWVHTLSLLFVIYEMRCFGVRLLTWQKNLISSEFLFQVSMHLCYFDYVTKRISILCPRRSKTKKGCSLTLTVHWLLVHHWADFFKGFYLMVKTLSI